ncbi:MAG: DNA repair protein [Oscillospiraceae bacterium]|nr:DNA repair protein [Oscillospiraceae bacterium]
MAEGKTYFCIDMKSFYASVECAERGLDPFETCLAVVDASRGKNAICLAISPKMKALGIKNRCRISDIPPNVKYIAALPRMALYIDYAADIYGVYLKYVAPQDIHVYSIDESFLDVTRYLELYRTDAVSFAKSLMHEIERGCHIPSTAGVGTNLYLAKIALDITAKHAPDRIGVLTEESYRETLWDYRPITDFWMIAGGMAKRLERYGVYDMRGITQLPEKLLYSMFGINAELLIDHAWGREPCLMADIKRYKSKSKSVSFSQILPRNYTFEQARTVMKEMALNGAAELMKRKVIAARVSIFVGYSLDEIEPTKGSTGLGVTTALASFILEAALRLYDKTTNRYYSIRRLGIGFEDVHDEICEGYSLFVDEKAVDKERRMQNTVLALRQKYGKNAVLNGVNYLEEGTQRERNGFIGGHRAGNDQTGQSKDFCAV